MMSSKFKLMANGFIGGVVVTASISYSLFIQRERPVTVTTDENRERFPFGKPVDLRQVIDYRGHTVYHDAVRKQPLWVSEVITKDSCKGKATRRNCKFKRDDLVAEGFAAENADYAKSGWSRGHMAPAGNFKNSQEAMDHTFYLSNIVPQDRDNNSGFWNRFEIYCRDLTSKYAKVHVITGPVYKTNKVDGTKNYVQYEVIGHNKVPVPTHLYKVLMAYDKPEDKPSIAAFVVPNAPIAKEEVALVRYQVSIDELQTLTGFTFHPELQREKMKNLCMGGKDECKLSHWKALEIYFAKNKIAYAKSQNDVNDAVNNLKRYDIELDEVFIALINKKKKELETPPNKHRDSRQA